MLDKKTLRLHNLFLLANLTNALQERPADGGSLKGWSRKARDDSYAHQADTELAKLKSDIMGLSVRERKRIKAITREPKLQQASTIVATRKTMLPKIPILHEKDPSKGMDGSPATPVNGEGSKSIASGKAVAIPSSSKLEMTFAWNKYACLLRVLTI